MKSIRNRKGTSLVELMVTLVIFSIVVSSMYSVYNALLKQATTERKVAKTEVDVINVAWPLLKEIQTAGFGVPSSGSCTPAISKSGNELAIHSTAAGGSEHAGKWSYVDSACNVTGVPNATESPSDNSVVVINILDGSRIGTTTVNSSNVLSACGSYASNVAYWIPSGGTLECYETKYKLYNSSAAPATCATGTTTLGRSASATAGGGVNQPMLDCLRDLDYRFGCINSSGNLTWQTGTNCGTSKLLLMKVGAIVQSSLRRDSQVPATITLFEDLSGQSKAVTLTDEQRYFKWKKLEQTITLKNLE